MRLNSRHLLGIDGMTAEEISADSRHRRESRRGRHARDQEGPDAARTRRSSTSSSSRRRGPAPPSSWPRSGCRRTPSTSRPPRSSFVQGGDRCSTPLRTLEAMAPRLHRDAPLPAGGAPLPGTPQRTARSSTPATARTSIRPRRCSTPTPSASHKGRLRGAARGDRRRRAQQPRGAVQRLVALHHGGARSSVCGPPSADAACASSRCDCEFTPHHRSRRSRVRTW